MAKFPFERKLQDMLDKIYVYGGHHHYIKNFIIDHENEKVTIETDSHKYDRTFESIDAFLKYWAPQGMTNVPMIPITPDPPQLSAADEDLFAYMANKLKDNIDKVTADPKYIPQAKAINNNVNAMINLMKTKVLVTEKIGKRGSKQNQLPNAKTG